MSEKIVILGAGYAGIEAALTLHRRKAGKCDPEITLIDRNPYHTLLTELHEIAGNRIDESGVRVPLRDIFKYTGVRLVRDEIGRMDFVNKRLFSENAEYAYDYLILAAGSEPNLFNIPGMKEHAFTLWSLEDAVKIREHVRDCFIKASQEPDRSKRNRLLTFAVGGGGFTGVEMIGELALWVRLLCREYAIGREEVKLFLVEALPKILSNMKEKSIARSMRYLTGRLKVEVLTDSAIVKVTPEGFETKDGKKVSASTLIWTAGVKASGTADRVDCEKTRSGRLVVDKYTATQFPKVYAVGDISAFKSEEGTLPALVEAALQTGKAAATNILAEIAGKERRELKPNLHGVMVSIGSYFAVSDVMGRQWSRLISIVLKYMVNVHYLFGIGGFELVFKYIKHEFLYKKQGKTLPEDHISVVTPGFWLLPIRLFLGYAWLKEGIGKVTEGWLAKAVLAGLPPADAGTAASETETGEKVFRIISDFTPSWYAWIANHIVIPNALFFQILIVLAEIGLGLAFLSGTFTFIAGLASIGLIINFMLSTGFYDYNWWFIPAALCMLGGAGRAFGLDHYIMPWLMRQWRYFRRNRSIKLSLLK